MNPHFKARKGNKNLALFQRFLNVFSAQRDENRQAGVFRKAYRAG